ncbi:hypothetical protein Moror_15014 [Moniliophthora roreri MCA 2997]|uniref:Uncharacterized protein n=1 Tax=Moniliophthora roreri (strain MCA 2997) TaxID=1381753 RepID=V2W8L3_MONRO|nr:hypothetical protein Moror_15014 [Moniliophthora roreri MCA 2997]
MTVLQTPDPLMTGTFKSQLQNHPNKSNDKDKARSQRTSESSSPTNTVSMTQFLNVINAANLVTTHRIVEITSVQYVTHTVLTISLNIAHTFDEVSKFLAHTLPETIHLLMDSRTIIVTPPLSATSQMNHTSTEEPTLSDSPTVEEPRTLPTLDDREPITVKAPEGEMHTFIPIHYYANDAKIAVGTANVNRG